MSPILGIWASQNYPRVTNSYESIATVTVGSGGSSSISFTSIPSTFKHLQVRCFAQTNRTGQPTDTVLMRINSDTGSNYARHALLGDGSSASASGNANDSRIYVTEFGTGVNSTFGNAVIDILDYASVSKNKTVRTLGGTDVNGSGGYITLTSGLWFVTPTAITSILIYPNSGTQFNNYSSFALYGIKGA